MKKFKGVDLYDLDSLLTEEERMVRDTVREFVDDKVIPIIEKPTRGHAPRAHLVPEMAELGLFGANLTELRLRRARATSPTASIMQELERGDSGLRSFVSVQGSLVMYPIYAFGSEEQKDRWLPRSRPARRSAASASPSPTSAPTPAACARARQKDGDGWVLNGSKQWITNGTLADVAVVWAKTATTDEHPRLPRREGDARLHLARPARQVLAARLHHLASSASRTCRIPADDMLPEYDGPKSPLMCLNQARYGIAWGGDRRGHGACYDGALEYAKDAHPVAASRSPATSSSQEKLAEMATEISKAQLLALQLGRLKDEGKLKPVTVSHGQAQQRPARARVRPLARDILGANGIMRRLPGDPPHAEHRVGLHLRGHARHPRPDHRRGHHRHPGVLLIMIRSLLVLTLFACGAQEDPPKVQATPAAPADAKWKGGPNSSSPWSSGTGSGSS